MSIRYPNKRRGKLTNEQVAEIKARLAAGESCVALGHAYGTKPGAISHIKCGRTYPEIEAAKDFIADDFISDKVKGAK